MPFAVGARACIGKQSAIVEATAFLARIVAKYKIEVPAAQEEEWKLRPGESEIDRRERIYNVSGRCCLLRIAFHTDESRSFAAEPRHHALLHPRAPGGVHPARVSRQRLPSASFPSR